MLIDGVALFDTSHISNLIADSGVSFPIGTAGEMFYRSDLQKMFVYDGSEWKTLGSSGFDDLNVKPAVRVATTENITLNGTQTIDGVPLAVGDRVLVKNQSTGALNGIYEVKSAGWTRATDFDGNPSTEVKSGDFVFVTEGATNDNTGWVLATNDPIQIGSTPLTFNQFTGIAGAGGTTAQLQYNNAGALAGAGITTDGNNLTFTGSNRRINAEMTTSGNILSFKSTTTNGATYLGLMPNGIGTTSSIIAYNQANSQTNVSVGLFGISSAATFIQSGANGTGTVLPLSFMVGSNETMRLTPTGALSFGASGTAYGTSGQVLTSNGNAPPTWQAAAGGAATLTATQIGFGSGTNLLSGAADFTWNSTTKQLHLSSTGSHIIVGSGAGTSPPSVSTRSAGTRVVFYPSLSGSAVDYAAGVETGSVWLSTSFPMKYYYGTTNLMTFQAGGLNFLSAILLSGNAGSSGQVLTSAGAGAAPTWQAAGGSPGGATTQLQFNNAGTFGGDADLTWDFSANVLRIGSNTTPATIAPLVATSGAGADLSVLAGSGAAGSAGGNMILTGGNGSSTGAGGNIFIKAGGSNSASNGGYIAFVSRNGAAYAETERLRILSNGAWSVGSTGTAYGTSGQVLTSNGNAAPTWQTPSAGAAAAGSLTGTTLASNVVTSSLTSVGMLTGLTVQGTISGQSGQALTVQSTLALTLQTTNPGGNGFNVNLTTGASVSPGSIVMSTNAIERMRIGPAGQLGLSGANYGDSGQVLTSNGSGGAPSWTTIATGNQTITLSGDVTGSGTTAITATLASVGTAGTYRSVTTDAKGRVVSGTNPTTLAGYGITDAATADHTHTFESITSKPTTVAGYGISDAVTSSQLGAASGVATLGADSKIPSSQLPALAITDTFVVASEAAMLALTAETGDVAVRTDLNKSFILRGASASTLADWQELLTPTDAVLSVNGQTGAITLTSSNINEGTNLYYTDERVRNAISVTGNGSYNTNTGVITINAQAAAAAGTLTGTTLASNVVSSSLTSVGTLSSLTVSGALTSTSLGVAEGDITSATLTTSATTPNQVVHSISASTFRSAKFMIQVTSGSAFHVTEVIVIHNGTTAFMTEYGTVLTGASLATFDTDISGGNLRLLVTPVNAVSTIKIVRTAITV